MPEFSLAALRGLLPQMSGANFGTAGPQELADMPMTGLDKAVQGGVSGIAQQAMVPGQLAKPNPYPEGSEQWSWYNDQKSKAETQWAPEMAMTLAGGAGVVPAEANSLRMGIKAYHSSPHDFDAFDLSKIGTGEGAQVYGHGLYFAENPAVSGQGGQYWQQFKNRFGGDEAAAMDMLQSSKFDRGQAVETAQRQIDELQRRIDPGGIFDKPHMADAWRRAQEQIAELSAHRDLLASGQPVGPRTYEVNINADPAHFLDWDKGLHTQSPEVRAALEPLGFKADKNLLRSHDDALYAALTGDPNIAIPKPLPDPSGAQIYESSRLVPGGFRDKVRATERLQEAGIPGIKYLDEGSRGPSPYNIIPTPQGNYIFDSKKYSDLASAQQAKAIRDAAYETERTRNYVVFNPSIVDIMKKYGLAGLAPLAGYGAMAGQDQQQ